MRSGTMDPLFWVQAGHEALSYTYAVHMFTKVIPEANTSEHRQALLDKALHTMEAKGFPLLSKTWKKWGTNVVEGRRPDRDADADDEDEEGPTMQDTTTRNDEAPAASDALKGDDDLDGEDVEMSLGESEEADMNANLADLFGSEPAAEATATVTEPAPKRSKPTKRRA